MKKSKIVLALCTLSLLGACAQVPTGQPVTLNFQSSNESLLEDVERILELPAEAQKQEIARLSENNEDRDSRIKSAMIYTLTHSRYSSYAGNATAATVTNNTVNEQKLEKERKALAKQLKDSLEENQKLTLKARDEQMRADSLQQKLDELKNIEKTMSSRELETRK